MRRRRAAARLGLGIALVLCAVAWSYGCAGRMRGLAPDPGQPPIACCGKDYDESLQLTYLGVGGWLLRRGPHAVMTGAFFSHPSLLRAGFLTIAPDPKRIEAHLPDVSDVAAILIGHSHYDHIMDVPYIAIHRAPRAAIYGSETAGHILAAVPELAGRVIVVSDIAGDATREGQWTWTSDRSIRFMPLHSEHAPHFLGIHLYRGKLDRDARAFPHRAGGFKEGQVLTWLVDFMAPDGSVDFRVHFQDSASNPPHGFPPPLSDGKVVDAAILCGASFHEVRGYPDGILARLHPAVALVGHWEDFFIPPDAPLHTVRATNIHKFLKRLDGVLPAGSRRILSKPGATYVITRSPTAPDSGR